MIALFNRRLFTICILVRYRVINWCMCMHVFFSLRFCPIVCRFIWWLMKLFMCKTEISIVLWIISIRVRGAQHIWPYAVCINTILIVHSTEWEAKKKLCHGDTYSQFPLNIQMLMLNKTIWIDTVCYYAVSMWIMNGIAIYMQSR